MIKTKKYIKFGEYNKTKKNKMILEWKINMMMFEIIFILFFLFN